MYVCDEGRLFHDVTQSMAAVVKGFIEEGTLETGRNVERFISPII